MTESLHDLPLIRRMREGYSLVRIGESWALYRDGEGIWPISSWECDRLLKMRVIAPYSSFCGFSYYCIVAVSQETS